MACLSKVRTAIDTMTASERKLAQLILDDPCLVMSGSAKSIAQRCDISPASVVRFAKMLGFSSLREMRDDLQRDVTQQMKAEQQIDMDFSAPLEVIAPRISSRIISGLESTLEMLSYEDLDQAVQMLLQARTVYLYGAGASSLPAHDLLQKLVRVSKQAIYREDQDLGLLDAYYMTDQDVMVVFSYSGTNERVNSAVQIASSRGMKCIAVTRFGRTPLANMATITLPLPENEPEIRYAAVQSKYATLLVVDLLFVGYVKNIKEDAGTLFEKTRAIIRTKNKK